MSNTITVGRTVLYTLPASHPSAGKIRPAIITEVWSPECVNLHVLLDPWDAPLEPNDQSSVTHDISATPAHRTWHWPPRN